MSRPLFGTRQPQRSQAVEIKLDGTMLLVRTPYDPDFVAALKEKVASTDRRWDKARYVWLVAPAHAKLLHKLCLDYYSVDVSMPTISAKVERETRLLNCRYIGTVKHRSESEDSAFGWDGSDWSIVLPEQVLRSWFDVERKPDEAQSLYSILSIQRASTADEVKAAYRRLAKQWHPDVCHEPDAADQFKAIKHAFDILSDPTMRLKYNAGLDLQASVGKHEYDPSLAQKGVWRSPLRSGYILAEGTERVGRFVVEKILQWEDITDPAGRTLVATWDVQRECVVEAWV